MRRFLLVSLLLLVLVLVLGGIGFYLLHDEDFLKARLGAFVMEQTGRDLSVEGPLDVVLGRQATIEARGVRYQNAAWADPGDMVVLGHLRVTVDVTSLFGNTPVIRSLLIEDCDVHLQKSETGEANWDLLPESPETQDEPPAPSEGPPVLLLDTRIRDCSLGLDGPRRKQPLAVQIDELDLQLVDETRWQGRGSGQVNDEAFRFSGDLAPAGALLHAEPVRWDLDLGVGSITLSSSGSVEDPRTGQGADVQIRFSGPEMATVLERFELPVLSEGAFDFRLDLTSENQATSVTVDGDLGSLDLNASGTVDRLVWPQTGALQMTASGPDLQALGEALRVGGLAPEPYDVTADLSFDGGVTRARSLVVKTPHDRVEIAGVLGKAPGFAESDLTIAATTSDIGRWRARTGLPAATVGPASLDGSLVSDAGGRFSMQAKLDYAVGVLGVKGGLGALKGPFEPKLDISLESPDANALASRFGLDGAPTVPASVHGRMSLTESTAGSVARTMIALDGVTATLGDHRATIDGIVNPARPFTGTAVDFSIDSPDVAALGALFGEERLPAAPLTARGRVSRPDKRLRFDGLKVDLGEHEARVNGYVNPVRGFAGSDLEVELDSPDVAALASLFDIAGFPKEAMKLSVSLVQEGKGLRFRTSDVSVGEIALNIDGRIADLEAPLGLDANFDIRLPSLTLLGFLAPDTELPDLPLTARGQLRNEQDRTGLEDVRLTLGTFSADVSGDLFTDRRFALAVAAQGADASKLEPWIGRPLPAEPFSLKADLQGDPTAFAANGIEARLGASDARGEMKVSLGERKRISGRLESTRLDLSPFRRDKTEETPPGKKPESPFVFDETPVVAIADPGVDLDLGLKIAKLILGNGQGQELELGISMAGKRLQLNPLAMRGQAGGTISGTFDLDASGAVPELRVDLDADRLRLGLAAAETQDIQTYPPVDIDVRLEGKGVTQRQMASALNGAIRVYGGEGQVASSGMALFLSDFLTELFSALNPFAEKSDYTTLECTVIAATVVDGQVKVYPVVFQTRELTILSRGTVDLHTEKIDLSFNTKPRQGIGLSAGMLINPLIKVGGRLAAPAVELNPAGAAVSGGLAVATAGLSLLAKSTYDRFLSSKDPCGDARKEIDKIDGGQ